MGNSPKPLITSNTQSNITNLVNDGDHVFAINKSVVYIKDNISIII